MNTCLIVWMPCILRVSLSAAILVCVVSYCMRKLCSGPKCCERLHCFPSKEQYCPHSPVNWLITSLMRMEQPATIGTLSDCQVTSEPKTRTCLIWENGFRENQIPQHEAPSERAATGQLLRRCDRYSVWLRSDWEWKVVCYFKHTLHINYHTIV